MEKEDPGNGKTAADLPAEEPIGADEPPNTLSEHSKRNEMVEEKIKEPTTYHPDIIAETESIEMREDDNVAGSSSRLLKGEIKESSRNLLSDLELLQNHFSQETLTSNEAKEFSRHKNSEGKTEVHFAAEKGNVALLEALDRIGGVIDGRDDYAWTPSMYAVSAGQLEVIQVLYTAGADMNVRDKQGRTLLHLAACSGRFMLSDWLLGVGLEINATDFHEMTPLHLAAVGGHDEVVRLLIESGADLYAKDDNNRTALKLAQIAGQPKVIDLLLRELGKLTLLHQP